MDQSGSSSSPPLPPERPADQPRRRPQPVTHIVRVEARSGGLWKAVTFIIGLMLFGGIFFVGIGIGAAGALAARSVDRVLIEQPYRDGARRNRIAILPVEGIILDQRARFVRRAVDQILEDSTIRAVVLRVESPGGSPTASDHIWYQIGRLKDAGIPVVASYGSMAASGGYYVSCNADHIVAEETTVTGSIGVIAQVFTFEGLMDKVGIEPIVLVATHSPQKDTANNLFREWEERDRRHILLRLDAMYDVFRERVRDGRGHIISTDAELDHVADGSVFTAGQALENGLVDSIGYLNDAIALAEQLANLRPDQARVIRYLEPPTLFGGLGMDARAGVSVGSIANMNADEFRALVTELKRPQIMYLMP